MQLWTALPFKARSAGVIPVLWIAVSLAYGQPPADDVRALVQQAQQRIRELQAETDQLANQARTLLTELRGLELEREIRAQTVKKAEAELVTVSTALEQTSTRLAILEKQRLATTPGVRERLVELYKRGRGGYVRLLLQSTDLRALGRMSRGVAAVARLDRVRFEVHRQTIRAERAAIAELETRKKDVAGAQAEAVRARQAMDVAVAAHNRRIDELDRRRDLAARYGGELQTAHAELQQRVSGLAGSPSGGLPLAPFRGALEWPVTGRVLSRFGSNPAGRFGTAIVRNGIEIATLEAQQVRAVHGGTVVYAAPFTGFGTLAILDHGAGTFTLYGHLSQAIVAPGARVERGAVVGRAGRTPEGVPALYFELRIDGRPVDPVQWLRSTR